MLTLMSTYYQPNYWRSYLFTYPLINNLTTYLMNCLFTYFVTKLFTCTPNHWPTNLPTHPPDDLHTYLPTYLPRLGRAYTSVKEYDSYHCDPNGKMWKKYSSILVFIQIQQKVIWCVSGKEAPSKPGPECRGRRCVWWRYRGWGRGGRWGRGRFPGKFITVLSTLSFDEHRIYCTRTLVGGKQWSSCSTAQE